MRHKSYLLEIVQTEKKIEEKNESLKVIQVEATNHSYNKMKSKFLNLKEI